MPLTAPTSTPTVPAPRVTSRSATFLQGMAVALLLAVIGWVAIQMFVTGATVPTPATATSRVDDVAETARLVARGLIPATNLQPIGEEAQTAQLVARGLIPAATLQPARGRQADSARLAAQGLIPAETLRPTGDAAVTQSLIDRGLVPEGTRP